MRHAATLALGILIFSVSAGAQKPVIIQTNSAGDNIHLIDPSSNKVIGEIKGIEVSHGATSSPDGSRYYFSNEADHTLDVVDTSNFAVIRKIKLSGRPNNVVITKDAKRVYVAIRQAPGAVDIIDTASLTLAKSISTPGAIHNPFLTPDGKFIVAGSIEGRSLTVIDTKTETPVWALWFNEGVRPIAFDTNSDGSTKRMFVQITGFHGFYIVDFEAKKEVGRVVLPSLPPEQRHIDTLQGSPAHGIGVSPDGKTLWVCSKMNSHLYVYSMPDLKYLGGVPVGDHPDWLTFTADSKTVYAANAGSNDVSAVDIATRKELARIPVGQVPKRNVTAVLKR